MSVLDKLIAARTRSPDFLKALHLIGLTEEQWWFTTGRYFEALDELQKLRVSIARVAQVVDVDGVHGNRETPYHELCQRAENEEQGWSVLCMEIIHRIWGRSHPTDPWMTDNPNPFSPDSPEGHAGEEGDRSSIKP